MKRKERKREDIVVRSEREELKGEEEKKEGGEGNATFLPFQYIKWVTIN